MKTSSFFTPFLAAVVLICTAGITLHAQFVQHPDYSLGATDYIEAGMPSLDANWTAEDWQTAMDLLFYIAEEDKYALPRYQSEYSGDVFAALFQVDMPGKWELEGDITSKLEQLQELIGTADAIALLYFDRDGQLLGFLPEFMQVMLFNIELHKRYQLQVDELGDFPALYLELSTEPQYNVGNVESEILSYFELLAKILYSLENEEDAHAPIQVINDHGLGVVAGLIPVLSEDALYALRNVMMNYGEEAETDNVRALFETMLALLPE